MLGAFLLLLTGSNVGIALSALYHGSLGGADSIRESLRQAVPILIAGLGVAFALRAGLFNIGGNGQIYVGALCAALVGLYATALPVPILPIAVVIAGAAGGGAWGAIPGWMRSRLSMNEVITTLLLNFVGFWGVMYFVHGPFRDPVGIGYPWTRAVGSKAQLPYLPFGSVLVPTGTLIGIGLAVLFAVVVNRTKFGFELRLLGDNPAAGKFAGVPIGSRTVQTLAVSGALCGIAGAVELASFQYRVSDFFSPGFGFTAVAVALVANGSASGTVAAALFFGALQAGASAMESIAQVTASVSFAVQGFIIILLVAARSQVLQAKMLRIRRRRPAGPRTVAGGDPGPTVNPLTVAEPLP